MAEKLESTCQLISLSTRPVSDKVDCEELKITNGFNIVFERYQSDAKYRPPQLIEWAKSRGIADLGKFKPCNVWVENAKEVIPKQKQDLPHQDLVIP